MIPIGPSIVLSNRLIRKMLRLARATRQDIFYDLGCGAAQLCIIAVKEFNVRKAVGIENYVRRVEKARENVRKAKLKDRIEIRHEDIYESDFSDATIVYSGLQEEERTLEKYNLTLRKGCRLIMLACPLVAMVSTKVDYPFYLMEFPFSKSKSIDHWCSEVLLKRNATLEELVTEFKRDPERDCDVPFVKKILSNRFQIR